jgi:hypothetical protein
MARHVAQRLSETLERGQHRNADSARAPDDGYTLLMTINNTQAINPALDKKIPFDPVKDFDPIAPVTKVSNVLVANPCFSGDGRKVSLLGVINAAAFRTGRPQVASKHR